MTERLFDENAYITEFDATVLSCTEHDGVFETVLDKTAFFPEGGGQASDMGTLDGEEVLFVSDNNGVISHRTQKAFRPGSTVHGKIDFKERFRRMQNHSGEHIMSGIAHTEFGAENVGFHLSGEYIRVDFDRVFSPEDIARLERLVNEKIWQNLKITGWYPTPDELEKIQYRSKKEISGAVRLVKIEDTDVCACCAPHVRTTGEIGCVKIADFIKYKGGCRIEALCGSDAYRLFAKEHEMLTGIARKASAKTDEVPAVFDRMKNEIAELKQNSARVENEMMRQKLEAVKETEGNLCFFFENAEMTAVREFVNEAVKKCRGVCAAFCGNDKNGYKFIAASTGVNLKDSCKIINDAIDAKSGGSPVMIQGSSTAGKEKISEFFETHTF